MATKDKVVNLEVLKASQDYMDGKVSDLKSAITEPSYNLITGKIAGATIASNGKIGASSDFDLFIAPVVSGKTYSYLLQESTQTTVVGFFANKPTALGDITYNASRTVIDGSISITAPITGWMVYRESKNYNKPQINEGNKPLPYANELTAIDAYARARLVDLNGVENGSIIQDIVFSVTSGEGHYINSDGVYKNSESFNLTDPFDLPAKFKIKVKAAGSSVNPISIISKIENGSYVPLVLSNGNTPATYEYTAQEPLKIVVSYLVSSGLTGGMSGNILNSINTIGDQLKTVDNSVAGTPLSMFTDIVCIGDSLTYSAVFTDATHNRQAFVPWPTQIERVTGTPTTMQADSGKNPKTWFSEYGSTIAQSSGGNRLYITYFGHNATEQYPYTDTFETDCPENADPSTWADTLTGWWGRIINDIYAAGCKALIIRVSDSDGYRATQDAIIEDIAARWNVPVIDNPYLPDLIYHSATDSYANEAHYNDLGYMAFCRQLMTNINKMSLTDLGHLLPSNE